MTACGSPESTLPPQPADAAALLAEDCPSGDSLCALACQRGLRIGSAMFLPDDPEYYQVLAREFDIVTAENCLKFAPIHPEQDVYDFEQSDRIVDF
ncbi:endo-1,4-beta-xylanase, partial [bacterium]|nr:endo-1,4-beta-xylanase [bacterium]